MAATLMTLSGTALSLWVWEMQKGIDAFRRGFHSGYRAGKIDGIVRARIGATTGDEEAEALSSDYPHQGE